MVIPRLYFLKEDEQILVESFTSRYTLQGPRVFLASPFHKVTRRRGITLTPTEYLIVRNNMTGELRTEVGPAIIFLMAQEEIQRQLTVIPLRHDQYVKIMDQHTGTVRVEHGEQTVHLHPNEEIVGNIETGINIDDETAVLIRDTRTGQLDLVTDRQVFFPAANHEIVEVRKKIRLEDHETVIVKDRNANYRFRRGTDEDNAFFLGPHEELVTLRWSTGIHKDQRNLQLTRVDMRPKFMWYESEARTKDNVELILGITIFWQIADMEAMIRTTDDTPGDICSHARSMIIQAVSRVPLDAFLSSFNSLVREAVLDGDDPFYAQRGVDILEVEVRSVACKQPETQQILQEIIQEATDRLNRLQKQESENEVGIKKVEGQIESEKARGQLLEIRESHLRHEGAMEGRAEAERLRAFFEGLGGEFTQEQKLALFASLKKNEALGLLSQGNANLYFTPADVDLSIETHARDRGSSAGS